MEELEADSIEIIREAAATARNAVMLDTGDKRAWVMLRVAHKAFHPAPPPFPVMRADRLPGGQGFDVVFDAASGNGDDPPIRCPAPKLYNTRLAAGESMRVLALSNWTDLDVRRYIERESITVEIPELPDANGLPGTRGHGRLRVLACGHSDDASATARLRAEPGPDRVAVSFEMPVQLVLQAEAGFRGFCGRVACGRIGVGDAVRVLPSGFATRVKAILRGFHAPIACESPESVTLALVDDVEVNRGDVIVAAGDPPQAADQFEARVVWMDEHPMVAGRAYFLKIHAKEVSAQVTAIKYREDISTGAHLAARQLERGEVAVVNVSTNQPVVFEPGARSRTLGRFILIDKLTSRTAGAGVIDFALRRSANIHWQSVDVDKAVRAQSMHQQPRCIWFTGLPGSGKSTLANLLEKRLHAQGCHTYLLDGDNVRHGLNRDLGFTEADRVENIRRVAEVAKLMVDAGLIVIVSFISPFRAERRMARALFGPGEFVEVFVDTPLAECEKRDPKGLYAKARRGELTNMTGIDSPYEAPETPELRLDTVGAAPEDLVPRIIERL